MSADNYNYRQCAGLEADVAAAAFTDDKCRYKCCFVMPS